MHKRPDPTSHTTSTSCRAATYVAAAVLLGLAIGGGWVVTQVRMAPSAVPAEMSVPVARHGDKRSLSASTHQSLQRTGSGPVWTELSRAQRDVLAPLQERWNTMGELTKRRWLSLADGFDQLSEDDQDKLRRRMQTWANLSVQQRNQARLNFFSSRQLSADELQSKWDAYQALSEEEKRRLAAKAAPKARGAATVLRPPSKRKLASVPAANVAPASVANPPKILPPALVTVPAAVHGTPAPQPPSPPVQTAPVVTPQAAPAVNLPPLGENAPLEQATPSSPITYSHPDFPPVHSPQ